MVNSTTDPDAKTIYVKVKKPFDLLKDAMRRSSKVKFSEPQLASLYSYLVENGDFNKVYETFVAHVKNESVHESDKQANAFGFVLLHSGALATSTAGFPMDLSSHVSDWWSQPDVKGQFKDAPNTLIEMEITGGDGYTNLGTSKKNLYANNAIQGQYVPGLGVKNRDGTFGKGPTLNAGKGKLDTVVGKDVEGGTGDIITQGPQSVNVATKTLRSKFVLTGEEPLAAIYEQSGPVSDMAFESFSWVPDGYGLGPENSLHLLNKQLDQLRYGMEPMYILRPDSHKDMPFPVRDRDVEVRDVGMLTEDFEEILSKDDREKDGTEAATYNPIELFDGMYNSTSSKKELPRAGQLNKRKHFLEPYITDAPPFKKATHLPGFFQDTFQDSRKGTFIQ